MSTIRPFDERRLSGASGEAIAAAAWPGEGEPLVCVHGLTSSSRAFVGLANELPGRRVLAIDCRGRGRSTKRGPFGLARHVADLAGAMDSAGIDRAVIVGHSMGAYVAGAFCAAYPGRVSGLVFIDGGYAGDVVPANPDLLLDVMLGPFLEKLRRTWPSLDDYIAFYESTALYPDGVDDYGRIHFTYDLVGTPPQLLSCVSAECLSQDWRDVLDSAAVSRNLDAITAPLLLLRAPGGLTGTGDMVIPDDIRDAIVARVAGTTVADVPGTNHHTILVSRQGAQSVARAIDAFMPAKAMRPG